jgi:MYXO-CTERM domain-containing protein
VCNGLDDNCNGLIDENGVCQQCVPTVEVCNGIDDDCDGTVDDSPVDANLPCGLAVGVCVPGLTVCQPGGVLACVGGVGPTAEVCDGKDNDCNGVIDGMTTPCYGGPMGTAGVGVCHPGSMACTAVVGSGVPAFGPCLGEHTPSAEICDGLDNECNGAVDDQVGDGLGHKTGEVCCRFAAKCGVGICTSGAYACAGSQVVCDGGNGPSAEICDDLDNDCNGAIDDVPGKGAPCVLVGGCPGMLDCVPGVGLACVAAAAGLEVCNGIDDDCDGSIDEEPDVSQNDPLLGKDCDLPAAPNDQPPCKPGKTVCKAGAPACEGSVKAGIEVCDGIDNDCNGTIDEPNPCPGEGQVCKDGMCLDKCKPGEFPCAGGQTCMDGLCVPVSDGGAPTGSSSSSSGAGTGGMGGGGGSATASSSSGAVASNSSSSGGVTAGAGGSSTSEIYGLATGGGGCSCSMVGTGPAREGALVALAGLAALVGRRSRRRAASRKGERGGEA